MLIIISLLPLLLFSGGVFANWQPEQIPNPTTQWEACRRSQKSWLCDPDSILKTQTADWYDQFVAGLQRDTANLTCGRGFQVATALVQKMALAPGQDKAKKAREFAIHLHNRWQVGEAECQNGVLIFISRDDSQMHLTAGVGASNQINPRVIAEVVTLMTAQFKIGAYDDGFVLGTREIGAYLIGAKSLSPFTPLEIVGIVVGSLAGCVVLILSGWCVYGCYTEQQKGKKKQAYDQKLRRIKKEYRESLKKFQYQSKNCPICLEPWDKLDQMKLTCGHQFCRVCLHQQAEKNTKETGLKVLRKDEENIDYCPICQHLHKKENQNDEEYDPLEAELSYRLTSLHYLFPAILLISVLDDWTIDQGLTPFEHASQNWFDPSHTHTYQTTGQTNQGSQSTYVGML